MSGAKTINSAVYYQEVTTAKYMYATGIPEMTQFTMCAWLKWVDTDRTANYIFSFSNGRKFVEKNNALKACMHEYGLILHPTRH